jgi:hypothetical protein
MALTTLSIQAPIQAPTAVGLVRGHAAVPAGVLAALLVYIAAGFDY